jgi:hypothetical protein
VPPGGNGTPVTVNFNFGSPINLPAIIPVVIPVTARITPVVNFSPTFNIPFTLNLPDFNADFSFAFNPHFNAVNIDNELINWPPEGVPPGSVLDCPEVDLPPPLFEIQERIVGVIVDALPNAIIRGKTIVPRGSSWENESVYPRLGHVQFISSKNGTRRNTAVPATERFGYIPNPDPYGADTVQFDAEPGIIGVELYSVIRPVAIPIKADGTSPTQYGSVAVI